jgi:hypothetical protein
MPNGSGLTTEQYRALDALIAPLDATIQSFAKDVEATLYIGYHGTPDRRIRLRQVNGVERLIDVAPRFSGANNSQPACLITAMAWKDYEYVTHPEGRRIWNREIGRLNQAQVSPNALLRALESAYSELQSVREDYLSAVIN